MSAQKGGSEDAYLKDQLDTDRKSKKPSNAIHSTAHVNFKPTLLYIFHGPLDPAKRVEV